MCSLRWSFVATVVASGVRLPALARCVFVLRFILFD